MSMRASLKLNSRASIRASIALGRRSIMHVERKMSTINEDACSFEELAREADLETRPTSTSRLMQRL